MPARTPRARSASCANTATAGASCRSTQRAPKCWASAPTPASQVEAALEQCAARGVPVATVYSDGFAETGAAGAERERLLVEKARALGVRLLGPNCIGLVNVANGTTLTVNAVL